MDYEGQLYWAYYDNFMGYGKEALNVLVALMEEFEIVEALENRKKETGSCVGTTDTTY